MGNFGHHFTLNMKIYVEISIWNITTWLGEMSNCMNVNFPGKVQGDLQRKLI